MSRDTTFILKIVDAARAGYKSTIRDVICSDQGSFRACVIEATDYAYCNPRSVVTLQIAVDESRVQRFDLFTICYKYVLPSVAPALAKSPLTDDEISDLIGESFKRAENLKAKAS